MGTEISLDVGGMTLDWSKNTIGTDHGPLYQEQDRKRLMCDGIDYAYFEREGESPAGFEMSFSRSLSSIIPRLEMLGFRLETAREAYEAATWQWREDRLTLVDALNASAEQVPAPMSFDEYLAFVCAHPIESLSGEFDADDDRTGQQRFKERFGGDNQLARIPSDSEGMSWAYSEKSFFGAVTGFLDPYSTLRLLAECPGNLNLTVDWQYGPLVENEYATVDEFVPCARRDQTFLIATEGTSDVHILNHAIKLLRPDVADFFRFIDVSERHPFAGTGGLVKFAEGLAKIDVQNKIIFLFDNDAEGVEALRAVRRFKLPPNMSTLVLPDLEEFRQFPAQGPDGIRNSDINGKAAAIECYLDLNLPQYGAAKVVWTNYKKDSGVYHGALEYKESYAKEFFEQTEETIRNGCYDASKIERVLNALMEECSRLAMTELE
ncbi:MULTISPECIES: HEPN/Toprim-associated domain-containing protein [Ralstonia solanacearum species complex]|uniref:HEPN/Toprim-associated domain-containing protein n=1 Tax=Ralstonia solanacearum species complex TaxID=3116862 RepID=UPI0018D0BF5E|nr:MULTISPECIES: HEPN/Toprim-associated domain-containing protein [Ralstonia solanacearum species complex]MDN3370315.1 HEPN/Toprim-associated domain-containing protein [Ralstonia pseudosolanacearum]